MIRSMWDIFDENSFMDFQDLEQEAAEDDSPMSEKNASGSVSTTYLRNNEIHQLLIYPPDKGGISINTIDYMCLESHQYLNDIIIDFYLKWVHNNVIPENQRSKTFIFSSFFYKRLTTLIGNADYEVDVNQTAAQRRHARVRNWTKNVNLFEKDFIIIPINKNTHWFLAIICYPKLNGPVTFDTNIPVAPQRIKKKSKFVIKIGNTTYPKRKSASSTLAEIYAVGGEESERDETDGDDSDLASEDSDFENNGNGMDASSSPPESIKQPLILIFDSLPSPSRHRVVATLRDYLSCEYKVRMPEKSAPHVFNKGNMPGHCVQVPQQDNFTDCGLYLLQYVEHFFTDPIRNYRLPIKQLIDWFDKMVVTRKREDISILLQELMNEKNGQNRVILPIIPFPTLNGELVEESCNEGFDAEFGDDEMEEEAMEEEAGEMDMEVSSNEISFQANAPSAHAFVPTQRTNIFGKRQMQVPDSDDDSSSPESGFRNIYLKIRKTEN